MTLSLDMLRHGVTDGGPGFRGSSADALTEQGRQQMQLALAGKGGWDLVISSPLQRCESFAREFAEANGLPLPPLPQAKPANGAPTTGTVQVGGAAAAPPANSAAPANTPAPATPTK